MTRSARGFNDDPAWLVLGVGGLPARDRRHLDPRRAGALRQRARLGGAALRAPRARHRVHARPAGPPRPAAHRPGRLERLPQPQLLQRDPRRVLPDHARTRRAAWPSRSSSPALFTLAVREMADDRRRCGATASSPAAAAQARDDMVQAIDAHGWDGAWFRRAYDYFGNVVGSAQNEEGKIFIEPQGMAIMAGIGIDDGRAETALASVREHLATAARHRARAARRSRRYYLELGEISSYPPGYKENARHLLPHQPLADDGRGGQSATATARSTTTCASTPPPARTSPRSTAASRTSMPR